jgi:alpha-beta hydrolase superfamily lysophospholipase
MSEPNESIRPNIDVAAARKKIAHAQELGNWPSRDESFNNSVTPPTTEAIPQTPPRTHEEAMKTFHKIVDEYNKDQSERAQNKKYPTQTPPARTHEEAMDAFHKIVKEYKESQPVPKTPTPEKKSMRERLLDWFNRP